VITKASERDHVRVQARNAGRVKVSLRSVGDVDVADFAKQFGGGGHRKAAGLSLEGALADAQAMVLKSARAYLMPGSSLSAVA
jgi:phosphoesterase RecJ-like protein